MARSIRSAKLETRTARARLPSRRAPYWMVLVEGRALGYRRGPEGSSWLAKYRGSDGKRHQKRLGSTDDGLDGGATDILSFAEAQKAARAWFDSIDRSQGRRLDRYTVGQALDDYLAGFTGKSLEKTRHTIERHIRPALGTIEVAALTTEKLNAFVHELLNKPAVYRANRKGERKPRPEGPDAARRRRANANRIATPLKAALNRAYRDGKVGDDSAWRKVKPFANVSAPRIRYFTTTECKALVAAADEHFRPLVQAALLTGARWSELYRMVVRDVDLMAGTVLFPQTKGGRPRHVHLTDEGLAFFRAHCHGKSLSALVFTNAAGDAFGPSHQIRLMRETCKAAGVEHAGFHILRHTYGSRLAMAGVPMAVIAEALGHADERITRKHYAHLAPSYIRDAVRAGLGSMGIFQERPLKLVG
jgi:integrase